MTDVRSAAVAEARDATDPDAPGVEPVRYLAALARRIGETRTVLCLGVDPDPGALPRGYPATVAGVERFARLLIDSAGPYAAAIKPNLAFFEAFGSAGLAALERLRAAVPPGIPVVADAKRGDMSSTAARHAVALFDVLGADAVTASPYLGLDALEPLLSRRDRFVYVLCRTSNASAADLQDMTVVDGEGRHGLPLHRHVARVARGWNERFGTLGLVVGATAPQQLAAVRADAPNLPFLVPGVGAQGGDVASVLRDGGVTNGPLAATPGGALLVNVSRAVAGAAAGSDDPAGTVEAAARDWAARLRC